MIKYNIVMCYDNILVYAAAYEILNQEFYRFNNP